ncbi:hypothetical protein MGYG_04791 [Nannizzia gypsea CBS 118893]|uniref:Uncharacterized protein n=1 Tax=Arthroderma gypseum (strain ATCC MYA-4604 / CBS 118893) TaxID=535722 RepID=E4UWT5_ARTGP|nr:hypothetical protein MGYG_04791 [Nannizzia gypsea CBS 118893]EFR01788.1 hypothetical protein MGYG_04791 [Nannizzia gypsea CBS 118893]
MTLQVDVDARDKPRPSTPLPLPRSEEQRAPRKRGRLSSEAHGDDDVHYVNGLPVCLRWAAAGWLALAGGEDDAARVTPARKTRQTQRTAKERRKEENEEEVEVKKRRRGRKDEVEEEEKLTLKMKSRS